MNLVHESHLYDFGPFKLYIFVYFINSDSVNKFVKVISAFISKCEYSFFFRDGDMVLISYGFKVIKQDFNIFLKGFDFNKVIFYSNFSGFGKKYFGSSRVRVGGGKKACFGWFGLNLEWVKSKVCLGSVLKKFIRVGAEKFILCWKFIRGWPHFWIFVF